MLRLVFTAWALSKQADTSRFAGMDGSRITFMPKILIVPRNDSVVTPAPESTALTCASIVGST